MNILLLDDSPEDRMLATGWIKDSVRVKNVNSFDDPEKAINDFLEHPKLYDLIIVDLNLPKLNGYEVCRIIRQIDSRIPILIHSGSVAMIDNKIAYECGANELIPKSYDGEELKQYLKNMDQHEQIECKA
jgi:CheY-like chemotaxis protein